MRKISILVAAALVAGSLGMKVSADEIATSFKGEAGVTPDSILYPIDITIDNLRVTISSSDEKKAKVIADIAQERLGESEVMTEEGKTELADEALQEYNEKMTEAADKLGEIINKVEENTDEAGTEKLMN